MAILFSNTSISTWLNEKVLKPPPGSFHIAIASSPVLRKKDCVTVELVTLRRTVNFFFKVKAMLVTALPAIMQYSFFPCPLLSKLSDLGMYLIAAVSAVSIIIFLSLLFCLSYVRTVVDLHSFLGGCSGKRVLYSPMMSEEVLSLKSSPT